MKVIVILFMLFGMVGATFAQTHQTAYRFLALPVSAHAAALGGDNISLIESDETLIFNNPALLSCVGTNTLNFNLMNYAQGSNMLSAAFNRIVEERMSWAVSAQYMHYGEMQRVNAQHVAQGTFQANDISLAGYLSYMLTDKLAGGITAKLITSYIGDYHSIAVGVDLGLNYFDDAHNLSLSAVAKNLGGQLKAYDETKEPMPFDLQVGLTKRFGTSPFRVSATLIDLTHWNERLLNHAVAGLDVILSKNVWVGAGYSFRRAHEMHLQSASDDSSSFDAGLSFGAGLYLNQFSINLSYGKYHVSNHAIHINVSYCL